MRMCKDTEMLVPSETIGCSNSTGQLNKSQSKQYESQHTQSVQQTKAETKTNIKVGDTLMVKTGGGHVLVV